MAGKFGPRCKDSTYEAAKDAYSWSPTLSSVRESLNSVHRKYHAASRSADQASISPSSPRSRNTEMPRRDCNNAGNLRQLDRGLPANLDGDPALPIAYHDRKIAALFSTWSTQSRREFCPASDRDFSQAATLGFGLRENHSPVVLLTGTSCAMVEIQARDAAQCALAVAPRYGAVPNQRAMRLGIGWRSAG